MGLTALALLLLVLVLLSVPGPIKGLYWFAVDGEDGQEVSAGVLGWCSTSHVHCSLLPLILDRPHHASLQISNMCALAISCKSYLGVHLPECDA